MQVWLIGLLVFGTGVAGFFPPSFWLCGIGTVLVVVATLANSARTGQWYTWQNEGSLNWFEGWAAASGVVLLVVPPLALILRSLFT